MTESPDTNLMPEHARVWVLKDINTHPRTKFPYLLVPEDGEDMEMYLRELPEPGPHLVGDRFGITANHIYVLA